MAIFEVRKHFTDDNGSNYDILFKSSNEAEAKKFREKLPKDNKKVKYTVKSYFMAKAMSKSEAMEAPRNSLLVSFFPLPSFCHRVLQVLLL